MSAKEDCFVKNKKYELVPPDGGWGYMIWIAAIINFSAATMFLGCFGLIFNDLLKALDMGSTTVTLLGGINAMGLAISGYFTGPLLKVMSLRNLALLASLLFNLGVFCTIFVNSTMVLFICQALQFSGFGTLYNLSCTLINEYFLKKRLLAISFVQTISAVSAMVAPQLVRWSLDFYGFRGTLIIVSGVSLQTFVAVALMQPVDRHLKRVETTEEIVDEMKLLVVDKKTVIDKMTTPTITLTDTDRSFDSKVSAKSENVGKLDVEGNKTNEFKEHINEFIDLSLVKKFSLSASSMGPTYCLFAEGIFALMLPQALYSMGWNDGTVAQAISLNALGDLVTRAAFIFLSKWLTKIGSHEIYLAGLFIAVVTRLGMLWSENVTVILTFITLMGVARCSIAVLPPLILADSYSPDKFTSVIGIFMMMIGIMNLVLGPAVGAVRDLTNSYPTVFYIITSCIAVVILLWSIELCYKRNKHKRRLQREAEKARKKTIKNKGK